MMGHSIHSRRRARHVDAVHVRQAQVKDDQVRLAGRGQRQPLFTAAGVADLKLFLGQDGAQGAQDLRLIVDDQYMRRLGSFTFSSSIGGAAAASRPVSVAA